MGRMRLGRLQGGGGRWEVNGYGVGEVWRGAGLRRLTRGYGCVYKRSGATLGVVVAMAVIVAIVANVALVVVEVVTVGVHRWSPSFVLMAVFTTAEFTRSCA